MYDFKIDAADKPSLYAELTEAAAALTAGEPDAIANMANVAALLCGERCRISTGRASTAMSAASWCSGRSRAGRPASASRSARACAARRRRACEPQCVADVHAFPGHIACDAASRAELVVPIVAAGRLVGVLDLDSPVPGRFDQEDVTGCVKLIQRLETALAGMAEEGATG